MCVRVCTCMTTGNTCSESPLARPGRADPQQVESAGSGRRRTRGPQVHSILLYESLMRITIFHRFGIKATNINSEGLCNQRQCWRTTYFI